MQNLLLKRHNHIHLILKVLTHVLNQIFLKMELLDISNKHSLAFDQF